MKHKGFTIVEVALFIAITGLLFIGIAVGTSNSIQKQRFYDSTQTFAEFLRSIYSKVSNPQSVGDGRSDKAIYGKLIVFGEKVGLDGEEVKNYSDTAQRIYVYDVVGDIAYSSVGGSAQDMLNAVNANVVRVVEWNTAKKPTKIAPTGEAEVFIPHWGAQIETTKKGESEPFTGSILVVRHPRSGTINTLVSNKVIEVNEVVNDFNNNGDQLEEYYYNDGNSVKFERKSRYEILLKKYLSNISKNYENDNNRFSNREVDFCINQYGDTIVTDYRWDVRLVDNARNASGVEVIDLDLDLDLDEKIGNKQTGNRCRFY